MEQRLSEKEKRKRILIIIAIILLILIMFLFLIFNKKTYDITFDSNGGSEVTSIKVKDGDKVEKPDDPTREGYIFAGWYYLDELYDFNLPVKQNMTLEARWTVLGNAELEGITLNASELTLAPDGTAVLVATLLPEGSEQVKLIWTSSDESIATVDENGNIKALKEGTVTITVTTEDGKYSASCTVTVKSVKEETETETKSEENTNNNNKSETSKTSDKTNQSSTSSQPNTPNQPSTPSQPNTPSQPSQPSTPSQPDNPPKEPEYTIYLTAIKQAADQLFEYQASIKKDGAEFNDFESIIIGGHTYRFKVDKKVAANHVASHPGTAQMKLKDGTTVTVTIIYNERKI